MESQTNNRDSSVFAANMWINLSIPNHGHRPSLVPLPSKRRNRPTQRQTSGLQPHRPELHVTHILPPPKRIILSLCLRCRPRHLAFGCLLANSGAKQRFRDFRSILNQHREPEPGRDIVDFRLSIRECLAG